MTSKNQVIANDVKKMCEELNWKVTKISGSIIELKKRIKPNSNEEFCQADSEYFSILSLIPTTSAGSIWGTDGGGIGALSAMNSGVFVIKKSGCSIRVLNALKKII